jgi:hypothetical protein
MARDIEVIWVKREAEYFCKWDWTTQITLIRFNKSGFSRRLGLLDGCRRTFGPAAALS